MLKVNDLSYWEKKSFFSQIDFAVIGSGIVGCNAALELRRLYPDAKILVLERGYLPSGASTKNAGFAAFGSVTELVDDLHKIPSKDVWETVAMRWDGLQYLREQIGDETLRFQRNGSWDLIRNEDHEMHMKGKENLDFLNAELFKITGLKTVFSEDKRVSEKFCFQSVNSSFFNRMEGQIDTGNMMVKFHQLLAENNITQLNGIEVIDLVYGATEVILNTNIGEIRSQKVAICVNGFARQFLPKEDVTPARAQVIITKPIAHLHIKGTFHFQEGFYYFRNIDNRILFGGGRNLDFEGETTTEISNSEVIISQLKRWMQTLILPSTPFEIDYSWAGIMGVGQTKKPIIKMIHPRVAIGVRLGGMGVAIGSVTGKSVAALL